ncbi:MAG: lasso RiPP family leader peptide-containing protein [Acidobacteriia bacterium]|nr:lasso RiPP family leader peptide-containing protein [Terriglobia bacterium]
MDKPASPVPKKPYLSPVLTVHGTVRDLTQKNLTGGKADGGRSPRIRTSV